MQYLSLTRDIDGESGIVNLSGEDIVFLEYLKSDQRVAFHTVDNEFYAPGTLKYWTTALNNSGHHFKVVDRNNAVNIERIVLLDSLQKKAYFSGQIDKKSKHCTMAFRRYAELEKEFLIFNPRLIIS